MTASGVTPLSPDAQHTPFFSIPLHPSPSATTSSPASGAGTATTTPLIRNNALGSLPTQPRLRFGTATATDAQPPPLP